MLSKTRLEYATAQELENLRSRIEGDLTWREPAARESPGGRGEASKHWYATPKTRECGKERCKKYKEGQGHVLYWYLYFRRSGKLTSCYIGKMIPEALQ